MRSTYKQLYYINRSKIKADGTTSIMCRVTIDGKATVLSKGLFCRPDDWNGKKGETKNSYIFVQNYNSKNMNESITLDPLSYTSYYVESCFNETFLASGTCFFIKRKDSTFLITNWHVVSGRNNESLEYLDKIHAAIPNNLKVHIFKNQEIVEREIFTIPILDEEENPLWLEHPSFKEKVDVIAIKVDIPSNLYIVYVEDAIEPYNEKTKANIKDDVFVLGFPFGISEGEGFPIWKRASIASEPKIDILGRPLIYIDTASRSGMSGSPVIYKERRPMVICDTEPSKATKISQYYMEFVGVYSGRIGAEDEFKAQLGRVWKRQVIEDIINDSYC